MIHVLQSLNLSGSILAIGYDGKDRIAVIDSMYNLYFINYTSNEIVKHVPISENYDMRHKFEKSISISDKFDIYLTVPKSTTSILLSALSGVKSVSQINKHSRAQTVSKFSMDCSLLCVGDENGSTLIYQMPSGRLLTSLNKKPDHISALTISDDNRFIAVSCFDKTTTIFDFDSYRYVGNFVTGGVVEQMVFSNINNELNCVCRDQHIYKYDISKDLLVKSDSQFAEWPTTIANLGEKFLVVGSKDNNIYLLSRADLVFQRIIQLTNYGISQMLLVQNRLYVGFVDGLLKIIDLDYGLEEFVIATNLQKFAEATRHIEKNNFLVRNEAYSKYDEKWPEVIQEAKEMVLKGRKIAALNIVKPFFIDKAKEDEFTFCLGNLKHLAVFQKLIALKEYVKALLVADEKEFLKKTDEYKIVENVWTKAFHTAKELIAEDGPQSVDKAKEILQKFMVIKSKQELINTLFEYSHIYFEANKFINEKNFKDYFIHVQNYPFLKLENIYHRVLTLGTHTFEKMKKLEYDENIEEAIRFGEYLRAFLPLSESVEQELETLYIKKEMLDKISKNDMASIYEIVNDNHAMEYFKPFRLFHSRFIKDKNKAANEALDGNALGTNELMKPYLQIPYLAQAVFKIIKTSYLTQIQNAINSNEIRSMIDWGSTYDALVALIGPNNFVCALFQKHNINVKQAKNSPDEWDSFPQNIQLETSVLRYSAI